MFCISSCAYFNTFYNARTSFKNANKIINSMDYRETNIPAQAKTLLDEAIINSRSVINNHPKSKFVEEAYYIISVSMFLKQDYKGAAKNLQKLIDLSLDGPMNLESYLWLAFCELRLNNIDGSKDILNEKVSIGKLDKKENYLFSMIKAEIFLHNQDFVNVYKSYKDAIKYSTTDTDKMKVYSQLIKISDKNKDYASLVIFLDEIYPFLSSNKQKKEMRLLSIQYNKELKNFDYVVSEIEEMLDQSIFNDIRIKLFSELGKVYFEMGDYIAAKDIFEEITLSYSKKDETAEAYYYLAKINLEKEFDIESIKEFLNTSKAERSNSKHGKLSKSLLKKIDVLENNLDEYAYSTNSNLADSLDYQISDSLLFNIAQIYHFDFNQIDSAVSRYSELINKFPKSDFKSKSILVLSKLDSMNTMWSDSLLGIDIDLVESNDSETDSRIQSGFNYLNIGDYSNSYNTFLDIYNSTKNEKTLLYLGYIDEYYRADMESMLKNYIGFVNAYSNDSQSSKIKNKLSSYYYILHEEIRISHLKISLLKCNRMIESNINYYLNNTEYDMILGCYEEVDENLLLYSEDSLKIRLEELDILDSRYSKFKKDMNFVDQSNEVIKNEFDYLYGAIQSIDSTYIFFDDSTMNIVNSYSRLNQNDILEDIKQMSDYLLIFNNLSVTAEDVDQTDNKESIPVMDFKNLNLEGIDLEKLKLP